VSYLEDASKAMGEVKLRAPEKLEVESFKIPGEDTSDVPEEQPTVSRIDSGVFTNEIVKDEELKEIASQHGVKLQQLRDMADLYGATREVGLDETQGKEVLKNPNFWKSAGLEAAGLIDEMGLNIPSWIYKKMQSEGGEKAFDAVRKLVDERRSMAGTAMRVALPGAGAKAAAAAKGIKAAVGTAAGLGAISGLTASVSGEEIEGAASGAAMSGALVGALSPEAISKFTGLPVFKKIKAKFNRPDVAVDTLEGFKQIKKKLTSHIEKFDDIVSNWGFVKKEGVELSAEQKNLIGEYAGINGELSREASKLIPKDLKFGSKEYREEIAMAKAKILADPTNAVSKKAAEIQGKLADVGGFISPDRLDDAKDMVDQLRSSMTKIATLKAKATKAQILEGQELSELGDFFLDQTISPRTFMGKGGVSGFSVGTKYTTSLEEGMPTQMHEFTHRIVSEVADAVKGKTKLEPEQVVGAIYDRMNSKIDGITLNRITNYLSDKGYPESQLGQEIVPWMQNILNDSKARNEYRDWLRKADDKAGVDDFMQDWNELKRASKKITKWAEDVDEDKLAEEIAGATGRADVGIAAMRKAPMQKPTKAELEKLPLEGDFIDIPGFKIVDNGFSYDVIIDGKKVGSDASYEFAKTRAQDWKRKNPDKLEKLVEKPEPRGTYIPKED
jgi:hypothetical protein